MINYDTHFFEQIDADSRRSAEIIVPMLIDVFHPRSVVDVGCGSGIWLSVFAKNGVEDILGLDSNELDEKYLSISTKQFIRCDLTSGYAAKVGRKFDLATSFEVAEHLPRHCAKRFVNDLTELSDIVAFSAAIPLQGATGTGHVNENWPEYWAALFREHKYHSVDYLRPKLWYSGTVAGWYIQNTILYLHEHVVSQYFPDNVLDQHKPLSLIHPYSYIDASHNSIRAGEFFIRELMSFHETAASYLSNAQLPLSDEELVLRDYGDRMDIVANLEWFKKENDRLKAILADNTLKADMQSREILRLSGELQTRTREIGNLREQLLYRGRLS